MSPKKPWWRRWFGSRSERAAARFLKGLGYRILARNYLCKVGEIDLIARDGDVVVFVEVRSTEGTDPVRTAASVDRAKQARISKTALYFLHSKRLQDRPARFDVLIVRWTPGGEPVLDHFPHAFEAVGDYSF